MQWKRWLGAGLMLLAAASVQARPSEVRKQMEASLSVAGVLTVTPAGEVTAVGLDDEASLPPGVRDLVKRSAAAWRFDPVRDGGRPLPTQLPMSLRLVANQSGDGSYLIRIRSAHFGGTSDDAASVRAQDMIPPRYPETAFRAGATGTVYLLLKVGRDGAVEDAFAEQVNLTVIDSESRMQRWRDVLANASLQRARSWRFQVPAEGPDAGDPFWVMRVPVSFSLHSDARGIASDRNARWQTYVPGPRQSPSWRARKGEASTDSPDALPDSGLFLADGAGVRLLTPLQEG